jgi:membrane dipeptidase
MAPDFAGGFGAHAAPAEIDTVADLPHLIPALAARGYTEDDIAAMMHGNWLRVLHHAL